MFFSLAQLKFLSVFLFPAALTRSIIVLMLVNTVALPRFVMLQNFPLCGAAHYIDIVVTNIDGMYPFTAGINYAVAATVPATAQTQQHQAGC